MSLGHSLKYHKVGRIFLAVIGGLVLAIIIDFFLAFAVQFGPIPL